MAKKQGRKQQGGKPLPKCKAILPCERVIVDEATGQPTLVGLIDEIWVGAVSSPSQPVMLFLSLVEGIGRYMLTMELYHLEDERSLVMSQEPIPIEFVERLQGMEVIIPLSALSFEEEGTYDVVVLADGQELDRTKFIVSKMREADDEPDSEDETSG